MYCDNLNMQSHEIKQLGKENITLLLIEVAMN